jgi:uncharacterized protein
MFIKQREEGVTIRVKVTPNAGRDSLNAVEGDRLGVKLKSPPVEGKANKSLVKFIGKKLGVAPSFISILYGHSSREKVLLVSGVDEATVRKRLGDCCVIPPGEAKRKQPE